LRSLPFDVLVSEPSTELAKRRPTVPCIWLACDYAAITPSSPAMCSRRTFPTRSSRRRSETPLRTRSSTSPSAAPAFEIGQLRPERAYWPLPLLTGKGQIGITNSKRPIVPRVAQPGFLVHPPGGLRRVQAARDDRSRRHEVRVADRGVVPVMGAKATVHWSRGVRSPAPRAHVDRREMSRASRSISMGTATSNNCSNQWNASCAR
jgi:hypothetical protein